MATKLALNSRSGEQRAILKLIDGDPFFQHMKEDYGRLARRVHELFEGRGRQDGHDLQGSLRSSGC
jgi:hypothetical protein